jgi:hypothetical protein
MWRSDDDSGDIPTISRSIITATDEDIGRSPSFQLFIRHVRSFNGKGFMPYVGGCSGGSGKNGEIHLGTDLSAYESAVKEGNAIMWKLEDDFQKECRKLRAHNSPFKKGA